MVFLYAPMLLVVINAFNASRTFAFPPTGFTLEWWVDAVNSSGMWQSLANSAVVGPWRDRDRAGAGHDGGVRRAAV